MSSTVPRNGIGYFIKINFYIVKYEVDPNLTTP